MNLFEKTLNDLFKSIHKKKLLVEALLIPKFIRLYKIDLDRKDKKGNTALMLAAEKGYKDLAERLIKAGADLDKQDKYNGYTALMWAIQNDHKDALELLIKAGADLDKEDDGGETALTQAALRGHKEATRLLIKAGADINKPDHSGWTALMGAIQYGHTEIADLLTQAGAYIDIENIRVACIDGQENPFLELLITTKAKQMLKAFLKKNSISLSPKIIDTF